MSLRFRLTVAHKAILAASLLLAHLASSPLDLTVLAMVFGFRKYILPMVTQRAAEVKWILVEDFIERGD